MEELKTEVKTMKHITTLLVSILLFARLHAQDQEAIKIEANKYCDILKSLD